MIKKLPVVLIGPVCDDPSESVSSVNKSFINGLLDSYHFVPLFAGRQHGLTQQAKLNFLNGYYFARQLCAWTFSCIRHRPSVGHYAISSGWAMEKGLVFLSISRAFGGHTIGHLHSGAFLTHWKALPGWRSQWARRQLIKLDALIVLSQTWRDAVIKHLGLPAEKVFIVNNPIDAEFEQLALQIPVQRRESVILSLGVMGRDKGVMEALQAAMTARRSANFFLQLAGPEREPSIYERVGHFIAEHDLQGVVGVKPSVWGEEKVQLFRQASIFLLPSYYENFPLVILEAAAAGHAIITTPVGAVPEFFEDGVSALFVEPGNSEQIAQAVLRLVNNPVERCRLGRAAREVFNCRLGRSRIMESLDAVYQCLLTDRSAKEPRNVSTGVNGRL